MSPIEIYAKFISEENTLLIQYTGRLKSAVDVLSTVEKLAEVFESPLPDNFWMINDYTLVEKNEGLSFALISSKIHRQLSKILKDRVIERLAVIGSSERKLVFVTILGAFLGKKPRIFKDLESARTYVKSKLTK